MLKKLVLFTALFTTTLALDNGIILTPPMGWSSWNKFHCGISSDLIRRVADAVKSTGLSDYGYDHINLDDCWMAASRDKEGNLQADPRFPEGMKALGDYLHSKGLKYGLYLDPGTKTCQRRAGSEGHEKQDAEFLASVGCDYLKHDACYDSASHQLRSYFDFRDAINATGRKIGYSICPDRSRCNDPANVMWDASSVAHVNMCRGDGICKDFKGYPASSPRAKVGDIIPTWHSWLCMLDVQVQFNSMQYAGPGHYVMPDMLEVGNGMKPNEDRAHFSMWAMIAAPLIMGHDVRNMSKETFATLTNKEIIAINQDLMGKPARRVKTSGYEGQDVWVRQLWNGEYAAALFNRAHDKSANITLDWAEIGLPKEQPAKLRDLWEHTELGQFTTSFTKEVPPHTVIMLHVSQQPLLTPVPAPSGQPLTLTTCNADEKGQYWQWSEKDGSMQVGGNCLDLYNCLTDKKLNLQSYKCHPGQPGCGTVNQKWILKLDRNTCSTTTIVSGVDNKSCITTVSNGLQTEPCDGREMQSFECTNAAWPRFQLKQGDKCLSFGSTGHLIV